MRSAGWTEEAAGNQVEPNAEREAGRTLGGLVGRF
jgi:hypothetical protein